MPIYEYQCKKCHETTEVLQKAKDKPLEKCPKCGGPVAKRISSPAIQFKGNGWYITDYAKKSSRRGVRPRRTLLARIPRAAPSLRADLPWKERTGP
jgi:putative FmdB family regulatory protein